MSSLWLFKSPCSSLRKFLATVSSIKIMKNAFYFALKALSILKIFQFLSLKNHLQNVVEKLSPDTFLKTQNWAYLWINSLKLYTVCFHCMPSWGYRNILKLSCRPITFTSYKAFLKDKMKCGTSLPVAFSTWFLKRNIYLIIFY